MTGHEAFVGVTVDHLYRDCPALTRAIDAYRYGRPVVGDRCVDRVDPEGTDVCGLCHRRWKTKQ